MKKRVYFISCFFMTVCLFLQTTQVLGMENSYTDFRIQDFNWVDDKEMALYLDSQGRWDGRDSASVYVSYDDFDYRCYKNNSAKFSFAPDFRIKRKTWQSEFNLDFPFSASYAYYDYYDPASSYFFSPPEVRRNIDFSLRPVADYTRYWELFSIGLQLIPELKGRYYNGDYWENKTYGIQGFIKLGLGRIQEGKYAYEAMQIAEELRENNFLQKTVTKQDMQALSAIIAKERRKYYLDGRMQKMDAIEKIAAYLAEQGYIQANHIKSVLIIDDIYRYIPTQPREFGEQLFLKFGGSNEHNDFKNSDDDSCENLSYYYQVGLGYEYHSPWDRIWQFDLNSWIDCHIDKHHESYNTTMYSYGTYRHNLWRTNNIFLNPGVSIQLQYILNTRWSISLKDTVDLKGFQEEEKRRYGSDYFYSAYTEEIYTYHEIYVENTLTLKGAYEINYNFEADLTLSWSYKYRMLFDHQGERKVETMSYDDVYQADDQSVKNSYWKVSFGISYRLF